MKKRILSAILAALLLCGLLPVQAVAAGKRMEKGVPVWTEETVKQYVLDYMGGEDMERLWGYYDLQIRRYMPMTTFRGFLSELAWKTGAFEGFGAYESYDDTMPAPDGAPQKVHVLHLCMEEQDLDLYFTHKNAENDWEVMAVEFVFAAEQPVAAGNSYAELMAKIEEEHQQAVAVSKGTYTEEEVTVGEGEWALPGTLTMPDTATEAAPVPAVILVHGSGPNDRDETVGQTKLFADIAHAFAEQGIAVLRYDKRTYVYPGEMAALESVTVAEETIDDALLALKLIRRDKRVDKARVVLLGHSLGGMLAPRIAYNASKGFCALILVSSTPKTLLDIIIAQQKAAIAAMPQEEQQTYMDQLAPIIEVCGELSEGSAKAARALTLFGVNGYYYYEMEQAKYDPIALIQRMKKPTLVINGGSDFQVSLEDGYYAYEDALLGETYMAFRLYKNLNHVLMQFSGDEADRGTVNEYNTPAHLDPEAAQTMIDFIKKQ